MLQEDIQLDKTKALYSDNRRSRPILFPVRALFLTGFGVILRKPRTTKLVK